MTEPTTQDVEPRTEEARLRLRHAPILGISDDICQWCGRAMPCDVLVLLDRLAATEGAESREGLDPERLLGAMTRVLPGTYGTSHTDDERREAEAIADEYGAVGEAEPALDAHEHTADCECLPIRVVVDQHGHYWRDYGDHWSMCPVSTENVATEPVTEFYRFGEGGDFETCPDCAAVHARSHVPAAALRDLS